MQVQAKRTLTRQAQASALLEVATFPASANSVAPVMSTRGEVDCPRAVKTGPSAGVGLHWGCCLRQRAAHHLR